MDPAERLGASLRSLGRRGLADAAAALLGGDPERTLGLLVAHGELPWIAGCCWTALAPLGVTPPTDEDSLLLRRVLVAGQGDATAAASAIAASHTDPGPRPEPLPTEGQPLADGLWQRALLGAYEDLWERVTWVYEDIGVVLRFGRPREIHAVLQDASDGLERAADRVALLARQVAGRLQQVDVPAGPEPASPPAPPPEPAAQPTAPTEPALTESETLPLEPAAVDSDNGSGARERRFLPIAFLALVTAAAGGYLYSLVYGWPPQLP